MTRALRALLDNKLLADQGLSGGDFLAWLLVYRSEAGPTGLRQDEPGQEILSWLLRDAVIFRKNGSMTEAAGRYTSTLWAEMYATGHLTIHLPDETVVAESQLVAEYRKLVTSHGLSERYGRAKELPPRPLLLRLFDSGDPDSEILNWLLEHCARLCLWDRYTEFGLSPTMICRKDDPFQAQTEELCERLHVPFDIASNERDLPSW